MSPDARELTSDLHLAAESAACRKSSSVVLYLVLPLLALFGVYHLILRDYLVFTVLIIVIAFNLAVILTVRKKSLAAYKALIYYYVFNLGVVLLGIFFLYLLGLENRFEYLPWSLTFIFPAFLIFPRMLKIPAVSIFLAALSFLLYRVDGDLVITGRDLLIRYLPSFVVVSVILYLFYYSVQNLRTERARAQQDIDFSRERHRIISERAGAEIERRHYEEKLLRQRIYLEELIEAAPEAIAVVDGNDRIERINTEFTRLFGYSPEEAVGRAINDLLSFPEVHGETRRNRGIVLSEGTVRTETIRRRKDGTTVQVSFLGTRAGTRQGLDRTYLIYRDITAREKAEQAQRESYEALVTVSDSIDADIYVTDLETHEILFMNKHLKDSFGDILEGESCHRLFMNREEACPECTTNRLLDGEGRPAGLVVWEGLHPLTNRFYIHYARAIKWVGGRYARLQLSTDATERKTIEEDLTRRVMEMAAFNSLGRQVNSRLSLEQTIQASLAEIKAASGSSLALLFLRNKETLELAGADYGATGWGEKDTSPIRPESCLCGLASSRGKPVYSSALAKDSRCTRTECLDQGIDSFAALPLIAEAEVLGVLGLGDKEGVDYSQRAEFLETAANEIAVGLHNAMLFKQLQDSAAQMEETIKNLEETQRDLKDSERKFTSFSDGLPALAYMKELSGKYLFVNKAFKRLLGFDPEKMIGGYDRDFFPEERVTAFRETAAQALESGDIIETIGVIEDIERKEHTVLNYTFPIHRSGKEGIVGGISLDITEKVAAEEARRKSESVARALFDLIPDTLLRFKRDGTITFYKGASGVTFDDFPDPEGRNSREFLSQEALAERAALVKGVLDQGNVATHEYTMDVGGRTYNMEARYIRYDDDEIMAIIQDTTERKSLEAQLAQSQKMEAIGVLASGIAHDFNNILQALSGHTQLLLVEGDLKPVQQSRINRIDQTIQRAAEVVRRLLTSSRKGETKFEPLDLNREVRHTVKLLKHSLPKMITIETNLEPGMGTVSGDPSQIEQVMMNLGANARDAMPDGGRLVFKTSSASVTEERLSAFPEPPSGDYIRLEVIDNGQGMEPAVAARIFEPFFTTKGVGRGTGLGLFTVHEIIRGHQGQIICESTPGEGTTFSLMFPAMKKTKAAVPGSDISSPGFGAESGTILLVDDEKHIRETGQEFLSSCGYEVLTAPDGETALEIFGREWPEIDLVILDLGMPGMGGHKALTGLLAINPQAKVLIASGYSVGPHSREALEQGAAGFIDKPYRLANLLSKIKDITA